MSARVSRHKFSACDATQILAMSDEAAIEDIEDLQESPESFGLAFSSVLSTAQLHCIHDATADKSQTWEAWVAAMQVGSAMFAAAGITQGSVECVIAHKKRTIPAVGAQHFADAGHWITAFWLAAICGEQGRMTALANVPVDLLRESGAVYDKYVYSWVDALQLYWLERPELGEKLIAAFNGTDPDTLRVADRELMLKILYPPLNLFLQFIKRDQEQFTKALVEALTLHKEYWTRNEERRMSTDGAVALGPLAVACLAYDVEMAIDVDSEYLPKHLVQRDWLGEYPT